MNGVQGMVAKDRVKACRMVFLSRRPYAPVLWLAAAIVAAGLTATVRPAAAQATNCLTLWPTPIAEWGEFVDGSGNPTDVLPCEEYRPEFVAAKFERFGAEVHIYVPKNPEGTYIAHPYDEPDYIGHPAGTPGIAELVIEAMYDSMSVMEPVHPGVDITVVVLETISVSLNSAGAVDWDVSAMADARSMNPCPVSIYMSTVMNIPADGSAPTPKTPAQVKATVAHEVYHCYQFKYFEEQIAVSRDDSGWWVEGTAKHFENLVYGCPNPGWARSYNRLSPTTRQGKGYPNLAFFGYLGKAHGLDVAEQSNFISRLPRVDGEVLQRGLLSVYDNIGEKFHGFGRQFVERSVDCIGPLLQPGEYPTETIGSQGSILLGAGSFQIDLYKVMLRPDTRYKVDVLPVSGGDLGRARRVSYGSGGNWTEILGGSFELETSCSADSYVFVASNTDPRDATFGVEINFEKIEDAPTPERMTVANLCGAGMTPRNRINCLFCERLERLHTADIDQCLVGQWRLKHGLWEHEAGIIRGMSGAAVSIEIDGSPDLFIRKDGSMEHPAFNMVQKITASGGSLTLAARINPGAGRWNTRDGKLELCSITNREDVTETLQTPKGTYATQVVTSRNAHVGGGTYTYSCHDSELKITATGNFPGDTRPWWLYERVSSVPPEECKR